jgi:TolB-like protein/DNA-binding winged helix-turn-helix (wHTH) protein/Tfp pilus assembly protein PilF
MQTPQCLGSSAKPNMACVDLRFGPYELKSRVRQLHKHGVKLKLRPQSFRVLEILLERPGDLISREELRQQLWPSDTFVDFEHGLNTSVKDLRTVLSDSPGEPRYIETLPRLGYRFIAKVEAAAIAPAAAPAPYPAPAVEFPVPQAAIEVPARQPARTPMRRWAVLFIALAALGGSVAGYFRWTHSPIGLRPAHAHPMLAVLPFENLTGDTAQDYFSDGMTEEMIAQLGRVDPDHLGVIARTSVMHYKHSDEQVDQIGRELGAEYVLEGSVRRDADKVRISAQLIETKDQARIWARQYDRELSGLLALQSEIAQEAADEILLALGEPKAPVTASTTLQVPKSYEAYDLYLKGRFFWNKRTPQGFERAVKLFNRAIEKDPGYAPAYAGLADTYAVMGEYGIAPLNEVIPKARGAALKALDLDEKLAEAHASLALIAQNYDWDWQTADKEFRRAIVLDPNYATGHHWYAEHLALLGRFAEAFPEIQRARQLDPLSLIIQADNAAFLYFSRQYDPAIAEFRAVMEMDPDFPRVHMIVGAYVQQGRFAEALADIETWRRSDKVTYWTWTMEAYVRARAGQPAQAQRALQQLRSMDQRIIDPFAMSTPYVGLGDKDQAFARLDKAIVNHSPGLTAIKVDPTFDPLRSDPRFQLLLVQVGLDKP